MVLSTPKVIVRSSPLRGSGNTVLPRPLLAHHYRVPHFREQVPSLRDPENPTQCLITGLVHAASSPQQLMGLPSTRTIQRIYAHQSACCVAGLAAGLLVVLLSRAARSLGQTHSTRIPGSVTPLTVSIGIRGLRDAYDSAEGYTTGAS